MREPLTVNSNAEAALLGSMLLDKSCIPAVRQMLAGPQAFAKTQHQMIYEALCGLSDQSDGWDLVIIRDWLNNAGKLEAVGGVEYLVKLAESVPSAANAVYYARLVSQAGRRRQIARQARCLQQAALTAGNVLETLQGIQKDLAELTEQWTASPADGAAAVGQLLEQTIRRQRLAMPWPTIQKLTHCLQPGAITILCGSPGASKSFMALQLLTSVIDSGQPAAVFELEDSRGLHLLRLLAQRTNRPELLNPDWVVAHPDQADSACAQQADWLRKMGTAVEADGGGQTVYGQLENWLLQRARAGCRLLIIDPITAVQHQSRQIWDEDNRFLQTIKRWAVQYGTAVVLVSHSVKGQSLPGLESLAGGACFSRFAQTILWLEAHEPKNSPVRFAVGTDTLPHNRTIHILKARLGSGHGLRIAADFENTLTVREYGIILRPQSAQTLKKQEVVEKQPVWG